MIISRKSNYSCTCTVIAGDTCKYFLDLTLLSSMNIQKAWLKFSFSVTCLEAMSSSFVCSLSASLIRLNIVTLNSILSIYGTCGMGRSRWSRQWGKIPGCGCGGRGRVVEEGRGRTRLLARASESTKPT